MRYQPGSFTKNYGWDEPPAPGLSKLHHAIVVCFDHDLKRVERDVFRQRHPDLDEQRQLVPVNFFLGNVTEGGVHYVVPDELVALALAEPHSKKFDMLALFALHLGRVGLREGRTGHQHAGRYLGDLIRDHVWTDGAWQRNRLTNTEIEIFLADRVTVKEEAETLHKCTTNYGFILNAVGVRAGPGNVVDLGAATWIESAVRLACDRVAIEEPPILPPDRKQLLAALKLEKAERLVGLHEDHFYAVAEDAVDRYLADGGYRRL